MPEKVQEFKEALKRKAIKLEDLLNMSSEERTNLLREYAGENAKDVNLLFEQKLILKNRLQGIKNAISKLAGLGRYEPAKRAMLEEAQAEFLSRQKERLFSPKENESYLNTLVDKITGTHITRGEARKIFDLSSKISEARESFDYKTEKWNSGEAKRQFISNRAAMDMYMDWLKGERFSVREMLKDYGRELSTVWKENKPEAVVKAIIDTAYTTSKTLLNVVANWDNSFLWRQGAITLIKSPSVWWNMVTKSFTDIGKTLGGDKMATYLLKAELESRPNGMNGNYDLATLFPKFEEETPVKLAERAPVLGRFFRAGDVAFENSAMRARAGLFDMMLDIYKETGKKADDVLIKDLGNVVNAITARGKVGRIGASKPVELLMWAPRMLKADWDILTGHTFGAGLKTNFAKVQAVKTIINVTIATAATVAIAKAMGAEVETDPTSSDYLQIKKNDTRIRIPFPRGAIQIVTLMARLATGRTKSTITGISTPLNSGKFGSKTYWDVGIDFLTNKTNPPARAIIDWMKGRDFSGEKPTLKSTLFGFLPISVQNFIDLKDQDSVAALGAFLDVFGISSSTYKYEDDWNQNPTKEQQQLKEKFGQEKFDELNKRYNEMVGDKLKDFKERMKTDEKLKNMSPDEQLDEVAKIKDEIKDQIFWENKFFYQREDDPKGERVKRQEKAFDLYNSLKGLNDAKAQEKIDDLYRKEGKEEATKIMEYVKNWDENKSEKPFLGDVGGAERPGKVVQIGRASCRERV